MSHKPRLACDKNFNQHTVADLVGLNSVAAHRRSQEGAKRGHALPNF